MTPDRLREILDDLKPLGVSLQGLAKMFGYRSKNTVVQWTQGIVAVPPDVARWLERLHGWWLANPPTNQRHARQGHGK